MAKSNKPTGLSITRNNLKFTFEWKCGDADYGQGQKLEYRLKESGKWSKWHNVAVGKSTTSKAITLEANKFFPTAKKPTLNAVQFRVKGNRKNYTTGTGKKKKKHKPGWSDWEDCTMALGLPNKPKVTESFNDEFWNMTTFSWEVDYDHTDKKPFAGCRYETILVKEGTKADWKKTRSGTSGATGKLDFEEDTAALTASSYTRWLRVRARGVAGEGNDKQWVTVKHVFAKPNAPVITFHKPTKRAIGYDVIMAWKAAEKSTRPIDKTTVQYVIASPDGAMLPYNPTWVDAVSSKDTKGVDKAKFIVDQTLGFDENLYARVVTSHDSRPSPSAPVIILKGKLSAPSDIEVEKDDKAYTVTVSVRNNSSIDNSYLKIFYRTNNKAKATLLGTMAHGVDEKTFKCPNWGKNTSIQIGAQAFLNSQNRGSMESNVVWYKWTIPVTQETAVATGNAPTNITVAKSNIAEQVLVSWKYTWNQATGMQITWSDDINAWSSTDEPSSYDVETKAPSWYISGLDAKKWYIRLRQIYQDGNDKYYSNWSDIVSIDLNDVPDTPVAPSELTVEQSTTTGDVILTWTNEWDGCEGVELSWSDDESAWESTNEPDTYDIDVLANRWIVSGLESGKTWYFRARGLKNKVYSPYSNTAIADLSATPEKPIMVLSEPVIDANGFTTASWGYVVTDTSTQGYAEICTATINGEGVTYGEVIAHTETAQNIALYASDLGWNYGDTYNLCVRVVSTSGLISAWSDPTPVAIAPQLTCAISQTSLVQLTITEDEVTHDTRTVNALREMPMTVTVVGADENGTTMLTIERARSYRLTRPDENDFNGFEGEVVFDFVQTGEAQITITNDMLRGFLDDGAKYRIVAIVRDDMNRIATASKEFEVHWSHQAIMPLATVEMNTEDGYAVIDLPKPTGAGEGDVIDIYRLSADKPVPLVIGAEFDTQYVDPFPTIGEYGGHRIVYRTSNGDYITEDNTLAWIDLGEDEGDILDIDYAIIDFDGDRIMLEYNIDVTHSWEKDFVETRYLGGSIQGDWNAGVRRTGSIGSVAVATSDQDMIRSIRRLAVFEGICHVRTKDGSNFTCNIDVKEQRSVGKQSKLPSFTFDITRVDPVQNDGVKYVDFIPGTYRILDENSDALMDESSNYLYGIFEDEEETE